MKRFIPYLLCALPLFAQAHWDSAYYHDSGMAGTTVKADWMKDLLDSQTIMQVSIPGTHDSASRVGGWYVQTQTQDIPTQLRAGIRFLDVRAKSTDGSLAIHHGVYFQNIMFGTVLSQVKAYLNAHPSEFVLMRVKQEESNDPDFDKIVNKYMEAPQYRDVIWRRADPDNYDPPRVGDVRGKIVVLLDYGYYFDSDRVPTFGMSYSQFDQQDDWRVSTNWDLYSKWEKVRDYLDRSQRGHVGIVNFLSGAEIAFPYFVASGHASPGTSAPRLATGMTTPGWSWKWKDFPRVDCFIGICTIAFEGTNVLARKRIEQLNRDNFHMKSRTDGLISSAGLLKHSPYVGVIVADFPGPGLIEAVVAANSLYKADQCGADDGCVETICPNGLRYRARYTPESVSPYIHAYDEESRSWRLVGPYKSSVADVENGYLPADQEFYVHTQISGQRDIYVRNNPQAWRFCSVGERDPDWRYISTAFNPWSKAGSVTGQSYLPFENRAKIELIKGAGNAPALSKPAPIKQETFSSGSSASAIASPFFKKSAGALLLP